MFLTRFNKSEVGSINIEGQSVAGCTHDSRLKWLSNCRPCAVSELWMHELTSNTSCKGNARRGLVAMVNLDRSGICLPTAASRNWNLASITLRFACISKLYCKFTNDGCAVEQDQYVLLHNAILDTVKTGTTAVAKSTLTDVNSRRLSTSKLLSEFQVCCHCRPLRNFRKSLRYKWQLPYHNGQEAQHVAKQLVSINSLR